MRYAWGKQSSELGVTHKEPTLCFNGNQRTDQANIAGLSNVPLRVPCKRTFNVCTGTPFNVLEYPHTKNERVALSVER